MKLKLRKAVSSLLCIMMLVTLLAGCGGTNTPAATSTAPTNAPAASQSDSAAPQTPSEPVNLVFWNLFNGGDATIAQAIFDEFNSLNPNIKIEFQIQDNAQYYTKLKTSILAGTGPDFAMSHVGGFLTGMANEGSLVPIDELNTKYGVGIQFDKYTQSVIKATTVDNKIYAVPLDNLVRVFMYNKELLKDTGLVDSNGNLTMEKGYDGFVKAMETVKGKLPQGATPFVLNMGPPQLVLQWLTFYYQLGGTEFVDATAKKVTFDEAKALEALKKYKALYDNYVPEKISPPADHNMFKDGQAAFAIDGAWNVSACGDALGDKLGVTEFPQLFDTDALVTTNHGFIVPIKDGRTEAQEKAVLEFIKWWGENNYKWSQAGHLPAYAPSTETKEFSALPYPKNYLNSMNYAVPLPIIPNVNLHQAAEVNQHIQQAMLGDITPEDAIKLVKQNLEQYISQF